MIILLCGLATFLLRWVTIWQSRPQRTFDIPPALRRMLEAIGPAAITSLLVVSLLPLLSVPNGRHWSILAALAAIWLYKRWRGGIAGPTLMGSLTYGACQYLATP
ncbi:AzlD domain-containing protein [Halomonas sp. WWR20]